MQKILLVVILLVGASLTGYSQAYQFQTIENLEALPVISQDNTGSCWSFSTSSFLESEIIRLSGRKIDLSEMFMVRNTYLRKARNFVMRQGHAQFGEGGLNHDVIMSAAEFGLVPESEFTGLIGGKTSHDHGQMVSELEKMLKGYADPFKKLGTGWKTEVPTVLDKYLGTTPTEFTYEGQKFTPQTFLAYTKLKLDDYVTITSFNHRPFYKTFILDIPDNFSNQSFYNVPLDEFIENIDNALDHGFTVALDSDVSEKTFSGKYGMAVIPDSDADSDAILTEIKPEKKITQEYRQAEFENFDTQDDHLMHIVGKLKDQKGNIYYKVKNSWSVKSGKDGFVYMSVPYVRLKAISVMVHKDALTKKTRASLGL